jgi:hypothetical protein
VFECARPKDTSLAENKHHPHVLQDYLEALSEAAQATSPQDHKLIVGYAEMKYRIAGGGKCPLCRAHVRHVVPVRARRENGEEIQYECLCQRCLLGEISLSAELELRIGDARVVYTREGEKSEPVMRSFVKPAGA